MENLQDSAIVRHLVAYADRTTDLVGVVDEHSRVLYLNEAARKRLGVGGAADLTTADLFRPAAFTRYYDEIRPILLRDGVWSGEIPVNTGTGDAVPMRLTIVAGVDPGGEVTWLVTHGRDVAEPTGASAADAENVAAFGRELAVAVSHGLIEPHVQPVVDLHTGTIAGHQALARWRHPQRGLLDAAAFVAQVADDPAAPVIDLAVLRAGAAYVAGHGGDRLYAHLSPRLLTVDHVERYVVEAVECAGLDAARCALEVPSAALAPRTADVTGTLGALRDLGFELVLTDVADAFDVADIVELGITELRLSPRLTAAATSDDGRLVARGTVGLARGLGLRVSAVAVETDEQRAALRDAGVDLAAGDLFGPVVPAQ